jgi:hypothetical protein
MLFWLVALEQLVYERKLKSLAKLAKCNVAKHGSVTTTNTVA